MHESIHGPAMSQLIYKLQGDMSQVNKIQRDMSQVNKIEGDMSQVNKIQGDMSQVNRIQGDMSQVNKIQEDLSQMDKIEGEMSQVNKMQKEIDQVKMTTHGGMSPVNQMQVEMRQVKMIQEDMNMERRRMEWIINLKSKLKSTTSQDLRGLLRLMVMLVVVSIALRAVPAVNSQGESNIIYGRIFFCNQQYKQK